MARPRWCCSAGVGITPMMSMLNQLLANGHQADITWLHACEQGPYMPSGRYSAKIPPNANLLSRVWYREPQVSDVQGEGYDFAGTMDLSAVKECITPQAHYYFCGPVGFMQAVKQQLIAAGIPAGQLHYEVLVPTKICKAG